MTTAPFQVWLLVGVRAIGAIDTVTVHPVHLGLEGYTHGFAAN